MMAKPVWATALSRSGWVQIETEGEADGTGVFPDAPACMENNVDMDLHDCQRSRRTIKHSKRMKENDKRTHRSTVTSIKNGVKMKI